MFTDFVFDFAFENKKVLVGRHRLVKPIFGAKYVQFLEFSPSAVHFVINCDLIDDFLSNNEHNKGEPVLGMPVGGIGEHPLFSRDTINEMTVRMFHYGDENMSARRRLYTRLLLKNLSRSAKQSIRNEANSALSKVGKIVKQHERQLSVSKTVAWSQVD